MHFDSLASFPGAPTMEDEHVVSTVLGNLETAVVLVCVTEPYITGSRE